MFYQTLWKAQTIKLGFRYLNDVLASEKRFFAGSENNMLPINNRFTEGGQSAAFSQFLPYLEHSFTLRGFNFNNKIGLSYNIYPSGNVSNPKTTRLLEWNGSVKHEFGDGSNFNVSYTQNTASFPLYQLLNGTEIVDFQTLAAGSTFLQNAS